MWHITIRSYVGNVFTRPVEATCYKHAENIAKRIAGTRNSIISIREVNKTK